MIPLRNQKVNRFKNGKPLYSFLRSIGVIVTHSRKRKLTHFSGSGEVTI